MALNSWQKLTRVLPGQPFGNGADGAYSSATAPTMAYRSCVGTATATTLTIESNAFTDGDVLLIIQMRGTGVGQWEINRVKSGGGTTSLTTQEPLNYTYTDSGDSQAQVVKIPQYTDVTASSGTWTPTLTWGGNTGGILVFSANGTFTPTATLSANGTIGGTSNGSITGGGVGYGFSGGDGSRVNSSGQDSWSGEGSSGDHLTTNHSGSNQGSGGGGVDMGDGVNTGAGGGNGTAGSQGSTGNNSTKGVASTTSGNSGLTSMTLGGGGGGSASYGGSDRTAGAGGSGGGIIFIFAKTTSTPTLITANGGNGGPATGSSQYPGGGAGAGGSILILSDSINIGTDKLTTTGGSGGTGEQTGGVGGKGRIAVYYFTSLTGSTSSTYYGSYTTEQDPDLTPYNQWVKGNIVQTHTNNNQVKVDILSPNIANDNSTKAELFWLGDEENYVTASIYAQSLRKYYQYRVYDQNNTFITSWSYEVTSEPHFRSSINSGPGDIVIRLARKFDSFGEDYDVKLYNHVEVWCQDREAPNGTLIYNGFISGYRPVIEGNKEYVEITLLHDTAEMSWIILRNGAGATSIAMNSTDPSQMFKNIINYYRADRPKINYSVSSVDNTSTTSSYTFTTYTIREALDKCLDLTPENWYWRIDPDNIAHLHLSNLVTPDHDFLIGRHISNLETWRRGEDILNTVYFVGQETAGVPMYRVYKNTASISAYGIHATKLVDQRVTATATADTMANRVINQKLNPEIRTTLTILDSNQNRENIGYDIESIRPGQSLRVRNIKQGTKTLSRWDISEWDVDVWDQTLSYAASSVIQIQTIEYYPGKMVIQASSRLPVIAKRVEDIQRNLEDSQTYNTPTTPTAG